MTTSIIGGQEVCDEDGVNYINFKLLKEGNVSYKKIEFRNYIFIEQEEKQFLTSQHYNYIHSTDDFTDSTGKEYTKLYLKNNTHRYYLCKKLEEDHITHYEGDINAVKRFYIQNQNIKFNQSKLRPLFLDIETDDRGSLDTDSRGKVIANSPILSCAFKGAHDKEVAFFYNKARDTTEGKTFKTYIDNGLPKNEDYKEAERRFNTQLIEHEKELLIEIYEYMRENYDVTLSYNGWRFDIPYLKQRFEFHGLSFDKLWTIDLDYMEMYKKNTWDNLKSFSLQNVALHEFDESKSEEVGKIDWREKTGLDRFFDLYLVDLDTLREYNIQDVELMDLIEDKYDFLNIHSIISDICHCPIQDTMHNSKSFDYAMLNEYFNNDLESPSKPSYDQIEQRKGISISGGYTYVYEPGLHEEVECFDFKSFYPTAAATYNISPETYVKELYPRLELVFTEDEIAFIEYAKSISTKYVNAQGTLNTKKYNKALKNKQDELEVDSMKELMFKFTRKYSDDLLIEYCKKNDYVMTPADINLDTRGWDIHPHRLFKREEGIFPKLNREFITERDKIKYELKSLDKDSEEYAEKDAYQMALKILANSGYGAFGFRSFRYFMKEMGDSITSSCRFLMKKTILLAQDNGLIVTHGDTDSSFFKNPTDLSNDDIEKMFYDFFNEYITEYNTNCKIQLKNPHTGEFEEHDHFIVYEHEKTFESCIVVKKKRYYYKQNYGDESVYETQGGAYKKTNTNPWAAELQKELCKDILDGTYNRETWYEKIKSIRDKVYSFELEEEHLIMNTSLNRPIDSYGKPMIDGKTGQPKINKDGSIRYSPVPVHVKLAKEMVENGEDVSAGDKINYIIVETGPQDAITIDDFRENPRYDCDYYYERIESPLIEILEVVEGLETYNYFSDCWSHSERVQKRLRRELSQRIVDDELEEEDQ